MTAFCAMIYTNRLADPSADDKYLRSIRDLEDLNAGTPNNTVLHFVQLRTYTSAASRREGSCLSS